MHKASDFLFYNNAFIYQVLCILIYRRRNLYSVLLYVQSVKLILIFIENYNFLKITKHPDKARPGKQDKTRRHPDKNAYACQIILISETQTTLPVCHYGSIMP